MTAGASPKPNLRRVLMRTHVLVGLLGVGLASSAMAILGLLALHSYAQDNLHLIARSLAYNVEASVVFNDRAAANEALAMIAAREKVATVQLITPQGEVFAQWKNPAHGMVESWGGIASDLLLGAPTQQPVEHQSQVIGELRLTGDGVDLLHYLLSGLIGILLSTGVSAAAGTGFRGD